MTLGQIAYERWRVLHEYPGLLEWSRLGKNVHAVWEEIAKAVVAALKVS
jgi:hypothetical protein